MISKIKYILPLIFCLIPLLSFANSEEIVGYWAVKCGGFGGSVEIESSNEVKINVNDNNLYISGGIAKDSDGKSKLFYHDVIESMNEIIHWPDISQSKPIADISVENGTMYIVWKGFFDAKQKKYVWKKEPDFIVASHGNINIEMKKCNFQ